MHGHKNIELRILKQVFQLVQLTGLKPGYPLLWRYYSSCSPFSVIAFYIPPYHDQYVSSCHSRLLACKKF